jgi:hypothetical protein
MKFDYVAEKKLRTIARFAKNRRSESRTLLQGVNGFLDILSAFSRSIWVKFG